MTDEELNEIEELAEEATPAPWCVAIRGDEVTIETTGIECFVVAEMPRSGETDVHDARFIRAMREYALPMVKALREAWEARDAAGYSAAELMKLLMTAEKDRDAALAEVERLKTELKASNETIDMLYERSGRFAEQADRHEAEVTRLRRHLGEIP